MNESKQPFTDHVTKSRTAWDKSRLGWMVAAFLLVVAVFFFCLWAPLRASLPNIQALRDQLAKANANLADAQTALNTEQQTNQDLIATLQSQIADLQREKEQAAQMSKGLEEEMRSDLESKDVTISKLQGQLTVNILDRIMFDSGQAILKPDGQAVLRKVAAILAEHPELNIHVIGHTDNVPIRANAHSRFASNWELSAARALAAVHFMTEQAGVDPHRVGAVAYGEYRPIADNATAEGRAQNRRIAITVLPNDYSAAGQTNQVSPASGVISNATQTVSEPAAPVASSNRVLAPVGE